MNHDTQRHQGGTFLYPERIGTIKHGETMTVLGNPYSFHMTSYRVEHCKNGNYLIYNRVRFGHIGGHRIARNPDEARRIVNQSW